MRPPVLRAGFDLPSDDLVVDLFAGGGGASEALEQALGRPVDIAINHSPAAIAMHQANHPETRHYCEDIFAVSPREACSGRRVAFLWASPDCTHHSRAKGGKPRESGRRALADVVIRWAEEVRPRVIFLENVEEFEDWGPLDEDGSPIKSLSGTLFRAWAAKLTDLGYALEWTSIVAADYGAPTTRKRLFLVARCDGAPVVFPEPTHGKGRSAAWRPASEIIDWSLPCPSIFERARPLAEATLRRIATGIQRYVIGAARPFIVPTPGGLVAPTLVQTGYGERQGQAPRALDLGKPLGTVVAGGGRHALVAALITKHYGGVIGHEVQRSLGTVTTVDHHALTTAFLTKFYGTSVGVDAREPLPTVTASGGHLAEVRAFLVKYYGTGGQQQDLFDSLHTVTTKARFGLVMVHGEPYAIADIGMRMLAPHELFAAQGFPPDYQIAPIHNGRPLTKTEQTALVGNSVSPPPARALVLANAAAARRSAA